MFEQWHLVFKTNLIKKKTKNLRKIIGIYRLWNAKQVQFGKYMSLVVEKHEQARNVKIWTKFWIECN